MKTSKLLIIGAGGHSRAVGSVALACGQYQVIGFLDLHPRAGAALETIFDLPVFPASRDFVSDIRQHGAEAVVLALGDNAERRSVFAKCRDAEVSLPNLIAPSAEIAQEVSLGLGNVVLPGVFIGPYARIGDNNLFNTMAIVEHEVTVGSHNHVAPRATLLGRAKVGDRNFVGSGSVVRDGTKIASDITVGALSFVHRNLEEPGVYIGAGARRMS